MQQRYGVCSAVAHMHVKSLRIGAMAAASLLLSLLWMAAAAWGADNDVPMPPPVPGIERSGPEAPGGPATRRDEPDLDEEIAPEAGEASPLPFQGGCPYRGRALELIV